MFCSFDLNETSAELVDTGHSTEISCKLSLHTDMYMNTDAIFLKLSNSTLDIAKNT